MASERRAAPDAAKAGLLPPGSELSMLGEAPPPATPACPRDKAIRPGCAELAAAAAIETEAAGLSTAAGDVVASAAATARRGDPSALAVASREGALAASARALPPREIWLAGLAAAAARLGCVIVALLAAGAVCREIVPAEGPGLAAPAT